MNHTAKSDIFPFRMYGNLYFIGNSRVSVHLIKTECGLVLIDTGWPDMCEEILDSIRILGFEAKDICAIFHSHGHVDHYGCTRELKDLSGAKTYISRIDNDIVNGTYDLSLAKDFGYETMEPFDCDVLIEDGDVFTFGNTRIRCLLTPGHSSGVLSFFINIEEGENTIIAGMHGGIGMNSMRAGHLKKYNLSPECRDLFRQGLHRLKNEQVDLVMGNHPEQNDTVGKLNKVRSGETVLDKGEWNKFLERTENILDGMIETERG